MLIFQIVIASKMSINHGTIIKVGQYSMSGLEYMRIGL